MFEELDFKNGKITHNDFDIDFSKPFADQLFSLKEDLFQVKYTNDHIFTIDIGWYPEMDIEGNLITYVIKNYDWEKPLFKKKSKDLNKLTQHIKDAIEIIQKQKNKQ